jgi:mono/diheme cytochrome c family protein
MNPFPIKAASLEQGKELYNIFCSTCHGEKADGNGYLLREDGGKYPAQPANLINEEFTAASNGRFYHSIMYGKNVMGGYADKLSYEERWNVIHYIRSLQAKNVSKVYSEEENTLNAFAVPFLKMAGNTPSVEN